MSIISRDNNWTSYVINNDEQVETGLKKRRLYYYYQANVYRASALFNEELLKLCWTQA